MDDRLVIPLRALGLGDLAIVGGKNANLGEEIRGRIARAPLPPDIEAVAALGTQAPAGEGR